MILKRNGFFQSIINIIFLIEISNQKNEVVYLEFKALYKDGANVGKFLISNIQEKSLFSKIIIWKNLIEIVINFLNIYQFNINIIIIGIILNIFNFICYLKSCKIFIFI